MDISALSDDQLFTYLNIPRSAPCTPPNTPRRHFFQPELTANEGRLSKHMITHNPPSPNCSLLGRMRKIEEAKIHFIDNPPGKTFGELVAQLHTSINTTKREHLANALLDGLELFLRELNFLHNANLGYGTISPQNLIVTSAHEEALYWDPNGLRYAGKKLISWGESEISKFQSLYINTQLSFGYYKRHLETPQQEGAFESMLACEDIYGACMLLLFSFTGETPTKCRKPYRFTQNPDGAELDYRFTRILETIPLPLRTLIGEQGLQHTSRSRPCADQLLDVFLASKPDLQKNWVPFITSSFNALPEKRMQWLHDC